MCTCMYMYMYMCIHFTFFLGGSADFTSSPLIPLMTSSGGGDMLRRFTVRVFQLRSTEGGVAVSLELLV